MTYTITQRTVLESKTLELHDDHFTFTASRSADSVHSYAYGEVQAVLLNESTGAICFYVQSKVYDLRFDLDVPNELAALEFFVNQSRASQGLPPISLTD